MIEPLPLPASDADVDALAQLLVDTVEHGAAVSFLAPLPFSVARDWWRSTLSRAHPRAVFLVARAADGIVGTVQMHPSWAPNQPQRGEIAKLMVHRRARRTGLARRLMEAIERAAVSQGVHLLTLDTKRGDAAEALYRTLGWTAAGTIPEFAIDSDGSPHDAVIFYKAIGDSSR